MVTEDGKDASPTPDGDNIGKREAYFTHTVTLRLDRRVQVEKFATLLDLDHLVKPDGDEKGADASPTPDGNEKGADASPNPDGDEKGKDASPTPDGDRKVN